jgi:hypothetical protein
MAKSSLVTHIAVEGAFSASMRLSQDMRSYALAAGFEPEKFSRSFGSIISLNEAIPQTEAGATSQRAIATGYTLRHPDGAGTGR